MAVSEQLPHSRLRLRTGRRHLALVCASAVVLLRAARHDVRPSGIGGISSSSRSCLDWFGTVPRCWSVFGASQKGVCVPKVADSARHGARKESPTSAESYTNSGEGSFGGVRTPRTMRQAVSPQAAVIAETRSDRSVDESADVVWAKAAAAARASLEAGVNSTTVLMPSGAGDLEVGLRVIRGFLDEGRPAFRAVVIIPNTLLAHAKKLYANALRDYSLDLITMGDQNTDVRSLARHFKKTNEASVILSRYEDMQKICLSRLEAKSKQPLDLMIFEAAHILRAGGYLAAGVTNDVIPASSRVFVSARQLAGKAPGSLLAPGQEPGYPGEEPQGKYGPEVFRLTHRDSEERNMSVPLRLQILQSTNASDVARELAHLHHTLGVCSIQVVPPQLRLTQVVNRILKNLTGGACRARTGRGSASSIDAVVVAGSNPDYVTVAQEFPRLARWRDGKAHGYVLVAGAAKHHAVTAWQALAIEDQRAEEALQRATVEYGRKDRRLKWEEVPYELRSLVFEENAKKEAVIAVARGIEALGDPWDAWLGRLLAYNDHHHHVNVRYLGTQFGHELGSWLKDQRERWERGVLQERKVARLRGLGVKLDVDAERFAEGLAELRKYVQYQRSRIVPWNCKTDSGFMLGEWVVEQRTLQRRGKLGPRRQQMLREAYFMWQPSEAPSDLFEHPEEPEAAELTRSIEVELRDLRWRPVGERRGVFRALVLKHHPDVSQHKHADAAIRFLSDVRDWFLAGN
eukprot:gb/GFBE01065568.1/.p1 GENE.gb/GFBE01065568.1/~~gb/GFBE01065568.1/.p1  ORF type:complete len:744 (+),score=125.30 gb/GFBE01065568.1/:1-2232(+)